MKPVPISNALFILRRDGSLELKAKQEAIKDAIMSFTKWPCKSEL